MDADEPTASILILTNDVWSILTPHCTSYEIYNLMTTSPAMMTRMRHSVRELEVCTSFRSMNKFPSNFVSQFSALKHLTIGLSDPHPDYNVIGLQLSMLPNTLETLDVRNTQVLTWLFGPDSLPEQPSIDHLILSASSQTHLH